MIQDLVVVFTTAGPGYADIIKGALQAAGIPAETSREGAGAVYGLTIGALGLVDVLVPANRAAEAQALLAAVQRGDLSDDSDDLDAGVRDTEPE